MKVTAKSTLTAISGRRLSLAVEAYNEKEKIGEGTHERVIILKERFSKGSPVEERLKALGLELPEPSKPVGNYLPALLSQGLLFISGQIPRIQGQLKYTGKIGADLTPEEGYQAARLCALSSLSAAKQAVGDLGKIRRVVRVAGFVRSAEGFSGQPSVVNGASDLFVELLQDQGKHARIAVGVNELPAGSAVELEVVFEVG
ncbi:MAG: RidA family protein [Candidatus Tectomicrobia bacterium]|uniref:RidA family protein n=1 Tax=Tectimicrobiota bacterium TaxID=2528274 RepID=A0A932LYY6_UNCTE|nr:RidA family protein [Candidatus Tectomicrobia bacterium]